VVDDDPIILQLCTTALERAGYRVQTAPGGQEALKCYAAASERFQLVISDVLMPSMTGIDLARQLRRLDGNVKVLLMSGQISSELAQSELEGVPFDFLPKPFRPYGLLNAVRKAIERSVQMTPMVSGTLA
jgi:DNA-binding NtrC family response regulator